MTRFNIIAGTAVVPLLARIVLCAAFLTAGWSKLMQYEQFTGEAADRLEAIGIVDVVRARNASFTASWDASVPLQDNAAGEVEEQDPELQQNDELLDDDLLEPPPDVLVEDPVTGERTLFAKRLHGVTLTLLNNGMQSEWAVRLAWLLAITELVSGALLLVGLFSRVWGFAIAVAMVVAFYLTSLDPLLAHHGPFGVASDMPTFNRMYAQLGLLVLALTVVLVGPGPVSLDRLIFRPRHVPEDEYV